MQAKVHYFVYYDYYYLHNGIMEPQKAMLILDESPGGQSLLKISVCNYIDTFVACVHELAYLFVLALPQPKVVH